MKKVLKIIGIVLLALIVVAVGYVIYVFAAYHRIEDDQELSVTHGQQTQTAQTDEVYKIACWNIGFGAYESDYSFFMDGGTESWAWSEERLLENLDAIGATTEQLEPDILLLQEVDFDATRTYHVDEALRLRTYDGLDVQTDSVFADHVNRYLAQDKQPSAPYHGETHVLHYLELLRDTVGFENLKKAVVKPLSGRRIAAYYGCMLLRPGKVMAFDDVENPKIMEDFIRALGAEPVIWARRNECCGGYLALEDPESTKKKSAAVSENAVACGAEALVTACPLCKYNLIKNGSPVPVIYFTELLAEALGVKEDFHAEQK